jgi:type IV secretion system protein VirB9
MMNMRQQLKKILGVIGCLAVLLAAGQAYAVDNPRALALDARVKTVPYEQNNVTNLICSTFVTTQVLFAKDQQIVDIEGSDAAALSIIVPKASALHYMFYVKPTIAGSKSDLIVTTMSNSGETFYYRFHVVTVDQAKSAARSPTYALQFVYPAQARAKLLASLHYKKLERQTIINASKNPKKYHWNYSFNGSRSIMPLHVFDDGKFTYMELQRNQQVPAIFAVNNAAGKESVVNFRKVGRYIVVQEVAPQFTLRDGKSAVASVFNNAMIHRLRRDEVL